MVADMRFSIAPLLVVVSMPPEPEKLPARNPLKLLRFSQ
jgi:hypothetical protein